MTGQEETLRDLAGLFVAAAAGRHDAPHYAGRLAGRLGIGRDADEATVEAALRAALGLAVGPAVPSLGERVTSALVSAGFIVGEDAPGRAAFHVTDGVGVSLGPFWRNASKDVRAEQLARIAYLLETKGGIDVPGRGRFLFVPEPKQAGQEAATAAGEDRR